MTENLSEQQQEFVSLWDTHFSQILAVADEKDLLAILPFINFGASTWFWNQEVQVSKTVASCLKESQLEMFLDNDEHDKLDVSDGFNKILQELMCRAKEEVLAKGEKKSFALIPKLLAHSKFSYPGHGTYNHAYSTPETMTPLYRIMQSLDDLSQDAWLVIIEHVFSKIVDEKDAQAFVCDFFSALLLNQKTHLTKEGLEIFSKQ